MAIVVEVIFFPFADIPLDAIYLTIACILLISIYLTITCNLLIAIYLTINYHVQVSQITDYYIWPDNKQYVRYFRYLYMMRGLHEFRPTGCLPQTFGQPRNSRMFRSVALKSNRTFWLWAWPEKFRNFGLGRNSVLPDACLLEFRRLSLIQNEWLAAHRMTI
jgi:hypothetical protein